MKLIDSYLNEVGRFLPNSGRDDTLRALKEDLSEAVEGRAEAENRKANVDDEHEVLIRFGHPLKVAGRYQSKKYLIGPDLYPAFIHALKVLFGAVVFIQVIAALVYTQSSGWQVGPIELFFLWLELTVWVFGVTVMIFVALEYSGERLKWYEQWQPQQLSNGSLCVISRGDVITNLISEGFVLLWLLDVIEFPVLELASGDVFSIHLSTHWTAYTDYLAIVFGCLFLLHFYVLIRGVWVGRALLIEIIGNTALLGIGAALLSEPNLIEASAAWSSIFAENAERIVKVAIIVIGATCIWDIWLAVKNFRGNMYVPKRFLPKAATDD